MTYYPICIVLVLAIIDWIAVEKKWIVVEYIAKPATMLALLGWIWLGVGFGRGIMWFTLGAIFCLAGDVFLMLPRDRFIFGLLAFLIGQVCYVIGFNDQPPFINLWGGVVIVILAIYIGWLYPKLLTGIIAIGKTGLKIPVLVYSLVISLMVYSALMTFTRIGWHKPAVISVSLGAILFYFSDSILAWDRFVKPTQRGRLMNMISYHLGQIGIILGAMLHITLK
jgi:uncharacterized membrane protein YhhN